MCVSYRWRLAATAKKLPKETKLIKSATFVKKKCAVVINGWTNYGNDMIRVDCCSFQTRWPFKENFPPNANDIFVISIICLLP